MCYFLILSFLLCALLPTLVFMLTGGRDFVNEIEQYQTECLTGNLSKGIKHFSNTMKERINSLFNLILLTKRRVMNKTNFPSDTV